MRLLQKSLVLSLRLWDHNSPTQNKAVFQNLPLISLQTLTTTRLMSFSSNDDDKGNPKDTRQQLVNDTSSTMPPPPPMSIWNGALRLSLEMASLVGLGHAAYVGAATLQPLVAVLVPAVAAVAWGTLNVPHDPSRGGGAPIVVSGKTRLVVEAAVLGGGGVALWSWNPEAGGLFCGATVVHYVSYHERIQWLLQQKGRQ